MGWTRLYTVSFSAVAMTAAQDLFMVAPATNRPIAIAGLFLHQTTDLKDAEEEVLRISIVRGHTTVGSGGNTFTPVLMNPGGTAAAFTARINDTTIASAGTTTTPHVDGWNIRVPYMFWWTPETAIICSAAQTRIVVRLMAAPADSITGGGTLYVAEV